MNKTDPVRARARELLAAELPADLGESVRAMEETAILQGALRAVEAALVSARPSAPVWVDAEARRLLAHEYSVKLGTERAAKVLGGPWTMEEDAALRAISAALSQQPAAVDGYIANVPDNCDRIVWRGGYYHLPPKQPAAVGEAMRKVAAIAHSGGLIGLDEDEALTAIRRLSLPYWQKEEKPEQVHAALAAQQQGDKA